MQLKIISATDCDTAVIDFQTFYRSDYPKLHHEFENFDEKKDQLDDFWFTRINIQKYTQLSFILKLIFCLFHGQASVERQFSTNNIVHQVNMEDTTIVSKKHIIDHMRFHKLKPAEIKLDQSIIKAVRSSYAQYRMAEENKLVEKKNTDLENKKLAISEDLKNVQRKCSVLEKYIKDVEMESAKCFEQAEKSNDMALVKKGNALKRSSNDSKSELLKLEEVQKDLKEKRLALK